MRIGFALFDGAEELDWAGPWEVLAAWATQWPDDGVEVVTVARTSDPVTCAKGLCVLPDRTWETAEKLDVPADTVPPPRRELADAAVLDWIRGVSAAGTLMTSVCTGSLDASIELRPDDRFVDSGEVVTAAGVSAGIDMALHLVTRLHSTERAREVRRYIQYDPEPPV